MVRSTYYHICGNKKKNSSGNGLYKANWYFSILFFGIEELISLELIIGDIFLGFQPYQSFEVLNFHNPYTLLPSSG